MPASDRPPEPTDARIGTAGVLRTAHGIDGELAQRVEFLLEIDRLKTVERRSHITGGTRRENSAEHSWHLAMLAIVLAGHSAARVDLARVVPMLLVHDIVEVDAGDTFVYDDDPTKASRERRAADRLFGLLPANEGASLRELWEEFEANETVDARFARALDRLQPLLLNITNDGAVWNEHDIDASQVRQRNRPIGDGAPSLWELALALIDDAVAEGVLPDASGDRGDQPR